MRKLLATLFLVSALLTSCQGAIEESRDKESGVVRPHDEDSELAQSLFMVNLVNFILGGK